MKEIFLPKSGNGIIESWVYDCKKSSQLKKTSSLGNIVDNSIQLLEGY